MACCFSRTPRHIQLVRALYTQDTQADIPPNSLEQFLFFATTNQTHLEDSSEYLAHRLRRKLQKGREWKVEVTIRVYTSLVDRVDPAQLGSLLDSLMNMLLVLLESTDTRHQLDASQLFLHYAVREEPAPAQHRTYQFLVERFGGMAVSGEEQRVVAGLQALRGIIKKTSQRELQPVLWQKLFVSHLLNAFLLNLSQSQANRGAGLDGSGAQAKPKENRLSLRRRSLNLSLLLTELTESGPSTLSFSLAQTGLQELLDSSLQSSLELGTECFAEYLEGCGPASETDIESVAADLEPIFSFFISSVRDAHRYLVMKTFILALTPAKSVSVQLLQLVYDQIYPSTQHYLHHSFALLTWGQIRLLHTGLQVTDSASLVGCIWEIEDAVVSLLKHSVSRVRVLRQSRTPSRDEDKELLLQEMVMTVLERLCGAVADYQKKETIVYIVQKLQENSVNEEFQRALMTSLLRMSAVCRNVGRAYSISSNLLESLINQFPFPPAQVQAGIQQVFQTFLDPTQSATDVRLDTNWNTLTELGLKASRASKQEVQTYKRLKEEFYWNLYELCRRTQDLRLVLPEVHRTLALLGLSFGCEVVQEGVFHFLVSIQDLALGDDKSIDMNSKIYLHSLVLLTFHFFSRLSAHPDFIEHARSIIACRWEEAPYMLPEKSFSSPSSPPGDPPSLPTPLPEGLILDQVKIGIGRESVLRPRKVQRKVTRVESGDMTPQPYPAQIEATTDDPLNFTDIREALDPSLHHSEFSAESSGSRQNFYLKTSTYEELLQRSDSVDKADLGAFVNDVVNLS